MSTLTTTPGDLMTAYEPPPQVTTPEKRAALAAFVVSGNVTQAMQAAGRDRTAWYRWRKEDEDFDSAAHHAEEAAADYLEAVARYRAIHGSQPSDVLLIFLLKGLRPGKYRDNSRVELSGPNNGPIQLEDVAATRERLRNRLAVLMGPN